MAFNLLQVGVLNKQKNQDLSIKALKKLKEKKIDAVLTLVGDGLAKDNLKKLARKLKLEDNVNFLGYIPNFKVGLLYKKCDLVLCPSQNETFSTVVLESIKHSKPCVVSADNGVNEILGEFLLISKPTVSGFYKTILKYLNNPKKYKTLAKKGSAFIKKNLTWEKYAQKFTDLIGENVPSSVYNEKYFDIHHNNPGSTYLWQERQTRIKRGLDLLKLEKGDKVLDLGCGNGEVAELMVKKGAKVWGIDYSQVAVRLANDNLQKTNAKIVQGRISSLPYRNNFFDKIICLDVIEHVYPQELDKALTEIERVIKPNGMLVVATSPNSFYLKPVETIAKFILGIGSFESNEYHINVFNYWKLRRLFGNLGVVKKIMMVNDGEHYFESRIVGNKKIPKWVKVLARAYDFVFENKISEFIILNTPLKIFFTQTLWAVVKFR